MSFYEAITQERKFCCSSKLGRAKKIRYNYAGNDGKLSSENEGVGEKKLKELKNRNCLGHKILTQIFMI